MKNTIYPHILSFAVLLVFIFLAGASDSSSHIATTGNKYVPLDCGVNFRIEHTGSSYLPYFRKTCGRAVTLEYIIYDVNGTKIKDASVYIPAQTTDEVKGVAIDKPIRVVYKSQSWE